MADAPVTASSAANQTRLAALVTLALAALTVLTFFGVWRNGFVDYDDATYIYYNPYIKRGLGLDAVAFAFNSGFSNSGYANNWHPLTWLSHALDCQFYGLNPAGHHATSLALHTTNVVLLFLLLRRLTGSVWRSAFVAALFGVHPLHVESVAWAAERKDVLSGFFFMLTLMAYAKYVAGKEWRVASGEWGRPKAEGNPKPEARSPKVEDNPASGIRHQVSSIPTSSFIIHHSSLWYCLALVLFALGLMSKPMLVTLPFVLLLLDYWPLRRLQSSAFNVQCSPFNVRPSPLAPRPSTFLPLVQEKIPFFLLSLVSCFLTLGAQGSAVMPFQARPLGERLSDAARAGVAYLQQTIWPAHLSVFYPRPALAPAIGAVTAAFLLATITAVVLFLGRRCRYLPLGWLWYLGMLVPVIGVVQVGSQAQADRYTYLPSIGIFILVAWGLGALCKQAPTSGQWPASGIQNPESGIQHPASSVRNRVLAVGGGAALAALSLSTHRQVAVWRDTDTLFSHAAKAVPKNYVALTSLANLELNRGHAAEALTNAEEVLEYVPQYPMAQYVAGAALQMQGRNPEALPHLLAIRDDAGPELVLPKNARLVLCFLEAARWADAQTALDFVLRIRPGEPNALLMQAALFREQGQAGEAVQIFRQALERSPRLAADNPTLNFELAELYALVGRTREAAGCYAKALESSPQFVNALNNFAWLLATDADSQVRDGGRAVELAERACRLTEWKQAVLMGTLAAALAEAGRFDDAVKMAERARDQAKASQSEDVAKRNAELLELYRQDKPYREPGNR